ncbi:MAG: TonB-dependent receptor [Proteobacteria bacterium]|nr:MAG: TonB-dependent receptor [Pseudomonadota bacterium]
MKGLGGGGGEGERKANAVYGELKIPIVSTLEGSVGGRWDDYTDFGDTVNSIAALQYRIGKEWFFRGNYGTGFKAPSLRDVHDSSATYFTSATDYKQCATATAAGNEALKNKYCGTAASGSIIQGGNPDLDPELSTNWGLFVGFEPVEGYGLSVEYFNSAIEDQIGSVTADDLTKLEANGKPFPTGTNVIRDPITGDIDSYVSPTTNLGSTKMDGIDTVGYAKQTFSFGTLSFRTNYNYLLRYLYNNLPGEAFESGLEKSGPRWKWNNTLGYSAGIHSVSIMSRSSGKIYKGVESYGMLGSYTRYELNYGVDIGDFASINVGGDNIFNQMSPPDDSDVITHGGGVTPTYYTKIDFRI